MISSSLKNKIPVLDKGFVCLLSSTLGSQELEEVKSQFFSGRIDRKLTDLNHVMLLARCPLFVQLSLSDSGLRCVQQKQGSLEYYLPTVGDIGAPSLETSIQIVSHMDETAAALVNNFHTYKMDGCNTYIAQLNSPVSVYTTILISGSLTEFIEYCNKQNLPLPLEAFRKAVQDIISANWNSTWELLSEKNKNIKQDGRKRS